MEKKKLLEKADKPKKCDPRLLDAIRRKDVSKIKEIARSKCNVNLNGVNAYSIADKGEAELVRTLVKIGMNIDAKDSFGKTPLMAAAWRSNHKRVKLLVECKADVHAKSITGSETALQFAMINLTSVGYEKFFSMKDEQERARCSIPIITFLLTQGAQISDEDRSIYEEYVKIEKERRQRHQFSVSRRKGAASFPQHSSIPKKASIEEESFCCSVQ